MTTPDDVRSKLRKAKRIVVKIGSRTLAGDSAVYERLAAAIGRARARGSYVVLVSSGAIALGTKKLGMRERPKEMSKLQAAAAAGQSLLMRAYEEAFSAQGIAVAQVLLTHSDLADRHRANNARAALASLLEAGALPILNENDSVAVDEIKFGDNDQLAAMVAPLIDADLLVLLSDVEGLLDSDGKRVPLVRDVVQDALPHVKTSTSTVGTGGMGSKIEAARRATLAGADAVVADARGQSTLTDLLEGNDVGTLFVASEKRLPARKYWIAFTLRPRGDVTLDPGAASAVRSSGKSVLSIGVLGVRGRFAAGDAVRILGPDGVELGRGLARIAAWDALGILGKAKDELPADGPDQSVLVHRDEMVIWDAL